MTKKESVAAEICPDDVLRYEESVLYEEKIRRLEDSISSLRMSRRILMSLLEQMQESYRTENERLLRDNARLRKQLSGCLRQQWRQNAVGEKGSESSP